MIAAAMSYVLTMTLLLTFAGLAVEKVLAMFRQPRRGVWAIALAASLASPGFALLSAGNSHPNVPAAESSFQSSTAGRHGFTAESVFETRNLILAWPVRSDWDFALAGFWILTSTAMLIFLATVSLQFQRKMRHWPTLQLNNRLVSIAEDLGPAVFGIFNPKIILPRWLLLDAHLSTRSVVLDHEQAHISGRDHLLLALALILVALMPWNFLLWWQLRRLRFAMEVDCDARVLKRKLDSTVYGEALLEVGRHRSSIPFGTMAMAQSVSRLERRIRIMLLERSRHRLMFGGACLMLAAACIAGAARLEPPSIASIAEVRKQSLNTVTPVMESTVVESYFPGSLRYTVPAIVDQNSDPQQRSSARPDSVPSKQ